MPTGLGSRPTFSYSHPRSSRYISFARQKPWFSAALRAASCPSSNALRLRSLEPGRDGNVIQQWAPPPLLGGKFARRVSRLRSEEHMSELQSLTNLVCP